MRERENLIISKQQACRQDKSVSKAEACDSGVLGLRAIPCGDPPMFGVSSHCGV